MNQEDTHETKDSEEDKGEDLVPQEVSSSEGVAPESDLESEIMHNK